MNIMTIDTLELSKRLQAAGVPQDQAEAHVRVLAEAMRTGAEDLATRDDLKNARDELKREMDLLRMEMSGKFLLLQWMMGVLIALAVANFAKQFF